MIGGVGQGEAQELEAGGITIKGGGSEAAAPAGRGEACAAGLPPANRSPCESGSGVPWSVWSALISIDKLALNASFVKLNVYPFW
jgi:hypothetical protein